MTTLWLLAFQVQVIAIGIQIFVLSRQITRHTALLIDLAQRATDLARIVVVTTGDNLMERATAPPPSRND